MYSKAFSGYSVTKWRNLGGTKRSPLPFLSALSSMHRQEVVTAFLYKIILFDRIVQEKTRTLSFGLLTIAILLIRA